MPALLGVRNLVKYFSIRGSKGYVSAVNDVSFEVTRGSVLGLVGESGSGKTTIGRCVLRLLEPTSGQIYFDGQEISAISQSRFRPMRARMQMVFQEPQAALNPRMQICQTLEEPLMIQGGLSRAQRHDRILELLHMVRLDEKVLSSYPHKISEGEAQRVGIGRAFATSPDLVVLDEPISVLDVSIRAQIIDLLARLQEQTGVAYILVTHDLTAVREVASRVAVIYLGQIVEIAKKQVIFDRPLHPYSRALLSAVLYPDPRNKQSSIMLKGEIPSPINLPKRCYLASRCPEFDSKSGCDNQCRPELAEVEPGHWVACWRLAQQ